MLKYESKSNRTSVRLFQKDQKKKNNFVHSLNYEPRTQNK